MGTRSEGPLSANSVVKYHVAGAEISVLNRSRAPFLSGFARLLRCRKDFGYFAEVLGGCGEEKLVICPAWSSQSETAQAEDAFEVGKEHFLFLLKQNRDDVLLVFHMPFEVSARPCAVGASSLIHDRDVRCDLALLRAACFGVSMTRTHMPQTPPRAALEPPRMRPLRSIAALVLREMGTSYGRSPGGYIWAILQPIGMIVILALAFSLVLRSPSLGTSFILFYATGYLPFNFYGTIEQKIGGSINFSRALLSYPGVTWVDAIIARLLLNMITSGVVFCLVISGILIWVDTRIILNLSYVINGVMVCVLAGLGVGLCNAVLRGLWPVWGNIWGIFSRPLFLASGVLFLYEDMPSLAQSILWWNPLMHGTGLVRAGFYPTYRAEYISLIYCYGLALVLIASGLIFMRATYKTILEN